MPLEARSPATLLSRIQVLKTGAKAAPIKAQAQLSTAPHGKPALDHHAGEKYGLGAAHSSPPLSWPFPFDLSRGCFHFLG
jgi:hypothetical protein